MTVVGIVLIVVLAIVLLLCLLLFMKASVRIVYNNSLSVYAGLSFFEFKVFPKKEKKKNKKNVNSRIKSKNKDKLENVTEFSENEKRPDRCSCENGDDEGNNVKKTESDVSKNPEHKKKSLSDTVSLIGDIIKKLGETFGNHGYIYVNEFMVTVSKDDAADTAIQFGIVCAGVSTALAWCSLFGKSKIKNEKVRVVPDFISGRSSMTADIKIAVRPIFVILAAISILTKRIIKKQ